MLIIKAFPMGLVSANAYLLIDEDSKDAVVIDIGGDYEPIKNEIETHCANLKYILNTHGHFDHIMGEYKAQKAFDVPVFIHEKDKNMADNLSRQLQLFGFSMDSNPPANIQTFTEDSLFEIGKKQIKILHTPGHTQGSVCFLVDNNLFSGDTLFYTSIGRTDFEGGSFSQISDSIKNKLFALDDDITVYPGHDRKTTIGYEKRYNCYFGSESNSF